VQAPSHFFFLGRGPPVSVFTAIDTSFRVTKAVTGPTSCHSVIISARGHAWVFGRNEKGQLGNKTKISQEFPIKVTSVQENRQALGDRKIIDAATGRNHTLLLCGMCNSLMKTTYSAELTSISP
jgi:hypothetical protein